MNATPNWQTIAAGKKHLRVIFDLKKDLIGNDDYRIPRNMSRLVKFSEGKWLTAEEDGSFHFYNGFMNGNSFVPGADTYQQENVKKTFRKLYTAIKSFVHSCQLLSK